MHICVVCVEARGQYPTSFSVILHLVFEIEYLLDLQLDSARLSAQTIPGILLPPLPRFWDYRHLLTCLALLHGSGDSNFWSCDFMTSAFLSGLPPQPAWALKKCGAVHHHGAGHEEHGIHPLPLVTLEAHIQVSETKALELPQKPLSMFRWNSFIKWFLTFSSKIEETNTVKFVCWFSYVSSRVTGWGWNTKALGIDKVQSRSLTHSVHDRRYVFNIVRAISSPWVLLSLVQR